MKKNKGFTLIELLAVIIILAVIALIATPTILNVIDNARRKAFEETARGYYNATRYLYNELYLKNERQDLNFTFEDGQQVSSNSNYKLEVSGEIPKGGLVYLSQSGQVLVSIHNNKYCANVSNEGKVSLSENIEGCSTGITNIPEECFEIKNKNLTSIDNIDVNEPWISENYNLLYYNSSKEECPTNIDTLIIPSEINGEKVEGVARISIIANFANSIKQIFLPEGMKVIDHRAFHNVKNLSTVILPDSLIFIGGSAFANTGLMNIEIPNGVKAIGDAAFTDNRLTSITIPESVITMGNGAFNHNQLTQVVIPNSIKILKNSLFYNNRLTSVDIPNRLLQ